MFDQPFTLLIFAGLAFKSAGFLVRDELWLRTLVLIGMGFDLSFYFLQTPAIWGSVITNATLLLVNLSILVLVVVERSTWFMSERERIAFENFKTLSPGQFRRINRFARWTVAPYDMTLLKEGQSGESLFFLEVDSFQITKQGQDYTAQGPAFAGEIMLMHGGVASATVHVPQGAVFAEWDAEEMRRLMAKSQPLKNALVARFGIDLAGKVRNSVPLPANVTELSRFQSG